MVEKEIPSLGFRPRLMTRNLLAEYKWFNFIVGFGTKHIKDVSVA